MYNEEIYKKLLEEFGEDKMLHVTHIISVLYDIKYNNVKTEECLCGYDYERDWWNNKHVELIKQLNITYEHIKPIK